VEESAFGFHLLLACWLVPHFPCNRPRLMLLGVDAVRQQR
jgi:hypothetical protein